MGRWRSVSHSRVGSVLLSPDIWSGIAVGLVAWWGAANYVEAARSLRDGLPTLVGLAVAVTAVVVAAHTLLVSLISPAYVEVLKNAPGGLSAASTPYKVTGAVSVAAIIAGVVAMAWPVPADAAWANAIPTAVPYGLVTWAAVGMVQLIWIGAFHFESREQINDVIRTIKRSNAA